MKRLTSIFLILVPAMAFAQAAVEPAAEVAADPPWLTLALALIVPVCGFLSTQISSNGILMKVLDVFAFNWGKAKNDSRVQ